MHDIDGKTAEYEGNHGLHCIKEISLRGKRSQQELIQSGQRIVGHCNYDERRNNQGNQDRGEHPDDAVPVKLFLFVHLLRLL